LTTDLRDTPPLIPTYLQNSQRNVITDHYQLPAPRVLIATFQANLAEPVPASLFYFICSTRQHLTIRITGFYTLAAFFIPNQHGQAAKEKQITRQHALIFPLA